MDRLVSMDELVERWELPRPTLYQFVARGQLPALKIGRLLRFREADLEAFLASRTRRVREGGQTQKEQSG